MRQMTTDHRRFLKPVLQLSQVLLLSGLLVACSTSPKADDPDGTQVMPKSDLDRGGSTSGGQETTSSKGSENSSEKPAEGQKHETPTALYLNLSEAYKGQNEEGIIRAASQVLSQNPNDLKALNAIGLAHYRKGRFLAARYFLGRAQTANSKSSEVMNNLGLVSLALEEPHEAMRYFKKALDLNSNDGVAAANLGSIYVHEGDYIKAQIALELAVKKGMRETKTLNNYGIALTANGKFDQAKKAYEEALKMTSNSQETLFNYAVLLIDHLKQNSDGLDQLNRLKFLGPAPEVRNKMNALENKAKAGIK